MNRIERDELAKRLLVVVAAVRTEYIATVATPWDARLVGERAAATDQAFRQLWDCLYSLRIEPPEGTLDFPVDPPTV